MVIVSVIIHPQGLHPMEAMRAWQLHREDGYSLTGVREKVHNIQGDTPSVKAVWSAIRRVDAMCSNDLLPSSGYSNCGRKPKLSEAEEQKVVAFVKQWRHKRFCTCAYIRTVLKLKVTPRCIALILNRRGFFWRPVPKVRGFSPEDLRKRKAWVDQHIKYTSEWWEQNLNLVLDGVTLTMAPKPLSGREGHARATSRAQAVHT